MLSTETPPALTGDIVTPDHAEWDIARRAWNLAVDQRPRSSPSRPTPPTCSR